MIQESYGHGGVEEYWNRRIADRPWFFQVLGSVSGSLDQFQSGSDSQGIIFVIFRSGLGDQIHPKICIETFEFSHFFLGVLFPSFPV